MRAQAEPVFQPWQTVDPIEGQLWGTSWAAGKRLPVDALRHRQASAHHE